MNKIIKKLLIIVIFVVIITVISFLFFVNYGGNSCDQPPELSCDCFCCHMFGLRGYESCGYFGIMFGVITGVVLGILINRIKFMK